ncbi:uncharacterized protein LOC113469978 [Diaphorina citri]|uniref:Uncharacterized protein LOC113469978 n=1 Tax=Diaphorina citri TaxID=121845 RepID=A0A3Q0J5X7_DIACI|nr:uncharacterized protein LOC113469978 [Diaphorina citri]
MVYKSTSISSWCIQRNSHHIGTNMSTIPVLSIFLLGILFSLGFNYLLSYLSGSQHHDIVLHKVFAPIPYDGSDKYQIPSPAITTEKHDLQKSSKFPPKRFDRGNCNCSGPIVVKTREIG